MGRQHGGHHQNPFSDLQRCRADTSMGAHMSSCKGRHHHQGLLSWQASYADLRCVGPKLWTGCMG